MKTALHFFALLLLGASAFGQTYDFGDLPDSPYPTKLPNGARHIVGQSLYIGTTAPDSEADGAAIAAANGDDSAGSDDEDGVNPSALRITAGVRYNLRVNVTNALVGNAWLHGFVDWNQDGDFGDANEYASVLVPGGSVAQFFRLTFDVPATAITGAQTALRLRLASDSVLAAHGTAQDGEVEDFMIPVSPPGTFKDFGDLPDNGPGTTGGTFYTGSPPDYKTLAGDGGPSHGIVPGLFFANNTASPDAPVDAEADGLQTALANGDNDDADNDELGLSIVTLGAIFVPDGPHSYFLLDQKFTLPVTNTTGSTARVAYFLDVNSDGDFDDPNESGTLNMPGDGSVTSVDFNVTSKIDNIYPATNFTRHFAMRFRITTDTSVNSTGAATDGEVMDSVQTYQFSVPNGGYAPLDYGDLPSPYATTHVADGARHTILQSIFLGNALPDGEPDGAPSSAADGDDVNGADDEDALVFGVRAVKGFDMHMPVKVNNNTGTSATLTGFVDWNMDGDFLDAGETSNKIVPDGSSGLITNLLWSVPLTASTGVPVPVRLRLSTSAALPPTGIAPNGEVEDFFITVAAQGVDHGDLPDSAAGTAAGIFGTGSPPDYKTRVADGGPSHVMRPGLFFNDDISAEPVHIDPESDGLPSSTADGDDLNYSSDEIGLLTAITSMNIVPDGTHSYIEIGLFTSLAVTNTTGSTAQVVGFIDANSDGDFDDPGETAAPIAVPGDGSVAVVTPQFNFNLLSIPPSGTALTHALRFRITTDGVVGPGGAASDGEVQDHTVTYTISYSPFDPQTMMDYGDLPAATHPTLWAQNGPRHVVTQTLFMGNVSPDGEADAHASASADGDDVNASDDEDGFNPSAVFAVPGSPVLLPVKCSNVTGNPAKVYGFVDWNKDGDFLDADEQSSLAVPTGSAGVIFNLLFNVPATTTTSSPVSVRLRLSTDLGLSAIGRAKDGEVEDYSMEITPPMDFGDLPGAYKTTLADNGPRHLPLATLFLGTSAPDIEGNGIPAVLATGDDSNASDDEDAISASSIKAVPGFMFFMPVTLTNNSGSTATVSGFADWNGDGDFADAGETSSESVSSSASSQSIKLEWNVPLAADTTKPVGVRLRIATGGALPALGFASNGEVEDFMITVMEQGIDYGDLPDSIAGSVSGAFGTASPPDYKTRVADGGPSHVMKPGLYFANDGYPTVELAHLDPESDGQPSSSADGDDNGGEDDEYLIFMALTKQTLIVDGTHSEFELELVVSHAVTNTTGGNANVFGFIDVNSDGDFTDPGEQSTPVVVPTGSVNLGILVPFKFRIPATGTPPLNFNVAVRCRISTEASLGSDGPAKDGEVQDDLISWTTSWTPGSYDMDYGDLNNGSYATTWADNGPRHPIVAGLHLGAAIGDNDADGHPSVGANGDDTTGLDDEDGLVGGTFRAYLGFSASFNVTYNNTSTSTGNISAFIDWNRDGDFLDSNEVVTGSAPSLSSGMVTLSTTVPTTASTTGPVPLRLRFSTDTGLGPNGLATNGEVEDYLGTVEQPWDFGDLPDSVAGTVAGTVVNLSTVTHADYKTRLADGGARHAMHPDLVLFNDYDPGGIHVDPEDDGAPSADADGDDIADNDDEELLLTAIMRQTFVPTAPDGTGDLTFIWLGNVAAKNTTGTPAFIHAFADANNDGDFDDPGEKGITDLNYDGDALDAGESTTIDVPSAPGPATYNMVFSRTIHITPSTYVPTFTLKIPMRIRLSTQTTLGPDGDAPDGEVEDYMLTVSLAMSDPRPSTIGQFPKIDWLIDKNGPANLSAAKVLPPNYMSAQNIQWRIGNTPMQGSTLFLNPGMMQSLGNGLIQYSIAVERWPNDLGGYVGYLKLSDLDTFRAYMDQHSLTDETSAPDEDADGDGSSNYLEFTFGQDPGTPGLPPQFEPKLLGGPGSFFMTLPYLRLIGGTVTGSSYSTSEATYTPQASDNLSTWALPLEDVPAPSGLPTPPTGYEWGAARIPSPITGGMRGFIRINVIPP